MLQYPNLIQFLININLTNFRNPSSLHLSSLFKQNHYKYRVLKLTQLLESLWIWCKLLAHFHLLIECNLKCNTVDCRNFLNLWMKSSICKMTCCLKVSTDILEILQKDLSFLIHCLRPLYAHLQITSQEIFLLLFC